MACILFFGPGSDAWAGGDTGTLIVTLNTPTVGGAVSQAYRTYYIRLRRRDTGAEDQIRYTPHAWRTVSPNDFASTGGEGTVVTKELSAGDWEVTKFMFETHSNGIGRTRFRPLNEFSIPFTIRPGRATYIGNFQPIGLTGKNLIGMEVPGGVRFVITDKSARDVPIAQAKQPNLGPVDIGVFDVDRLGNPLLGSRE